MRKNIAVIPKKTKVQIMGCSYELIDSVRVKGKQKYLNQALKAQTDFYNGVGIVGVSPKKQAMQNQTATNYIKQLRKQDFTMRNYH